MHLLSTRPGGFVEDDSVVTRLDQTPAEMVVLSSADTTLSLLADAYRLWQQAEAPEPVPTLRLANLLHLRQSASLDLYIDEVLQHARLVIVDHLGAESAWPYGIDQLRKLALARGQQLAMFSGDSQEDLDLLAKGTLAPERSRMLWQYLRAGGLANAREFLRMGAAWGLGRAVQGAPVRVLPPVAVHVPLAWAGDMPGHLPGIDDLRAQWLPGAPVVMLVFYRSHLLAANTDAFDAMAEALRARGLNPLPLALESLKDGLCLQTLRALCAAHDVQLILNTTAFAALGEHARAGSDGDIDSLAGDIPVLQVIASGANRDDWLADTQGLRPRDIAMQVVLPEMDGRIMTRAISFKGLAHRCALTQTDIVAYQPEPDRVQWVAELARRWCLLRSKPAAEKRAALVLANYPGSEARLGSGVGLDTPASVLALLAQLERDGWHLGDAAARPADGQALMERLQQGIANDPAQWPLRAASQGYALAAYRQRLAQLPEGMADAVTARWGAPEQDPMLREGWFMVAGLQLGHVFIGIQPARALDGRNDYAQYHDAELVPPHHYLAFYFWLRDVFGVDAMVHVGKHGNLEWLPGKSLALSQHCWPDAILGPLPHVYPFIVNDPGEGAQAKRRSQAVIIDHLMPPLARADNHGPMQELERLVDEYYDALLVDQRRAGLLRRQILDMARSQDLLRELGVDGARAPDEQILERIDAYLCELKETQIRDGLHVFGHSPEGAQRDSTLLALARYPAAGEQGLLHALAADLLPGCDWNPLDMDAAEPWTGPRPQVLARLDAGAWRHGGDTRERLELLALRVLQRPEMAGDWPRTQHVLRRISVQIAPALDACGREELRQFSRALQGRFVPPGPSGSPSRGRCDTLPTGRNFYTVDTRAIPTQTAWALGQQAAQRLLERYLQEHGEYPAAIGISVWGTATMRTGGDDIAQAFALIGVRPRWAPGSQRVVDFEVIPRVGLHRPRVDVTLRISGFFRDAFPGVVQMFDAAVRAVAAQEEDAEDNPIRARVLRDTAQWRQQGMDEAEAQEQALWRVFGAPAGSYGASMHELLRSGQWSDAGDFARHYLQWGAFAYGQQADGVPARQALERRLQALDVVLQNQDSREHDLLDSSEYYQHQGGMVAAVRHLGTLIGKAEPAVYHGDHGNPQSAKIRSLAEEIGRVVRARVTNPKWIAGAMRHGYKGAFEMAATVDYLFGFDATTQLVSDTHYALVTEAYVQDEAVRSFLRQHNPQALADIVGRLLEAIERGMWAQPGELHEALLAQMLAQEEFMEGRVQR
ncbi:cobaltochelatase subunit CobN [Oryzisolibacter sp. LB2S]|uniref:cobaltochelatase subunit CobN n=1 Tax=Alicycliphilus soli TaxID=3228789 RepID=UPI003457B991